MTFDPVTSWYGRVCTTRLFLTFTSNALRADFYLKNLLLLAYFRTNEVV